MIHVFRNCQNYLSLSVFLSFPQVTCEVSPHHLFLTQDNEASIGVGRSRVRPCLVSELDRQTLWENMDIIDCFATDHGMYIIHWPMYMYYSYRMPYKKEIGIKLWNFSYTILHFQKKSLALFKNPYWLIHNCRLCH